jgi:hypothetical protein
VAIAPAAAPAAPAATASPAAAVDGAAVARAAAARVARALKRGLRKKVLDAAVDAPASGDLTVTVTARRRVVARGRTRFAGAGRGVLHLKRIGRRPRGRLVVTARFTPDRGSPGSAKRKV